MNSDDLTLITRGNPPAHGFELSIFRYLEKNILFLVVSFAFWITARAELLTNTGFENGLVNWSYRTANTATIIPNSQTLATFPLWLTQNNLTNAHSGSLAALYEAYDTSYTSTGYLFQMITNISSSGYTFSVWAEDAWSNGGLGQINSHSLELDLESYDDTGTIKLGTQTAGCAILKDAHYHQFSFNFTNLPGAIIVRPVIKFPNALSAILVDDASFAFQSLPFSGPLQILQLNSAQTWQRLEFQVTNVPAAGNPFNPASISLDATFTAPSGKASVVPAFWYQGYNRSLAGSTEVDSANGAPQWRIRFTPMEVGDYSLSLAIQTNGLAYGTFTTNFNVVSNSALARFGYVGIASGNRYFQTGDGQALPLNGSCVCWPGTKATYDYDSWFSLMHTNLENYARIWMWPPSQGYFGIECTPGTLNNYSLNNAWQLDYVFQLAEQKGLYLQLCLDFHGMFWITNASNYNNDWQYNPYNSANGGPCLQPNAFFTNSTAQMLYQYRLRYLIGRYGYSQNLLSWEFFNEIDNAFTNITGAPASQSVNYNDCVAWHTNMAGWMRNQDPYHHLLTTSVGWSHVFTKFLNLPQLDYNQDHVYGVSGPATYLASDSASFLATYGKLVLIGEYGISYNGLNADTPGDPYSRGFRQGVWGGALGGSAGTAMSWWWDSFTSINFQVYGSLGKFLANTGWGAGLWTPISFNSSYAIGMRGSGNSLVYLTASSSTWPNGATTAPASLPVQTGKTLTLNSWPPGIYSAQWYDPLTATPLATNTATTTGGKLTLTLPNYSDDLAGVVTFVVPASVTVAFASTNITYGSDVQFTAYGSGSSPLAYQWFDNYNRLIVGGTNSTLILSAPPVAASGSYPVVVTNLYGAATNKVSMLVNPASLAITASNLSKIYGQSLAFSGTEFFTTPLVGSDTVTSVMLSSAGASNRAPVGTYSILPAAPVGTGLGNYNLTYTNGTLTVNAAQYPIATNINMVGGIATITFVGQAGVTYVTESAGSLSGPWTAISTNTSGAGGVWTVTDANISGQQNFYRTFIP